MQVEQRVYYTRHLCTCRRLCVLGWGHTDDRFFGRHYGRAYVRLVAYCAVDDQLVHG